VIGAWKGARILVEKPLKSSGGRRLGWPFAGFHALQHGSFAVQLRILRCSKAQRGRAILFAARKNIEPQLSEGLHTPRNCRIENL
jgi:hypothetical protein